MTASTIAELEARAKAVIPGGMYGHQSVKMVAPGTPQFFTRADGAYLWDAEGRQYLDLMCGYGPQLFGYRNREIDAAYCEQLSKIDTATGPAPVMVELAEALTAQISHGDWAMFCKNGTDATTMALMVARAHRGAKKLLVATGAYHGSAPWCTPMPAGTLAEDRAHMIQYTYNDIASLEAAAEAAGEDLAGIFASPFKHDVLVDQELPDPAYARRARELCDAAGALLIVDDIRAGFRLARDCSWTGLGIAPDLSCWGKALANGHPISALVGSEIARNAATQIYATGSFWFSAAPMAASLATLKLIRETNYLEHTERLGEILRTGLAEISTEAGLNISQTGPVQMPLIMFNDETGARDMGIGMQISAGMVSRGIYFHPWHNMFLSAAMTEEDIADVLDAARGVIKAL
ncbi:MAG: aminotransferase class III-fold pyridoxal phosphate-dependent enzyme [Hyphomonadaceae bacterium]|nr:aminotransferase class III-fold pyridoxal phosphate-dependent enzyme [Hyphomonadaceae bacterium]